MAAQKVQLIDHKHTFHELASAKVIYKFIGQVETIFLRLTTK